MEVRAIAKHIRIAPRKIRQVADLIRGLDISKAYSQLGIINKAAVRPIRKLLDSALANAHHNFEIEPDNLYIKQIFVDEGTPYKRWTPKAHGRATQILKRTSHISVILEEKVPGAGKKERKSKKVDKLSRMNPDQVKGGVANPSVSQKVPSPKQSEESKEIFDVRGRGKHREGLRFDKKGGLKQKGFLKKIFNRKSST